MNLPNVLRILAIGCLVPVIIHVTLGVAGDSLISAPVPSVIDASLDSQNRFYGASFAIYGVLLWFCAVDLRARSGVLRILLALFFLGGVARCLSAFQYGLPSLPIIGLWSIEVLLPPVLWIWLDRHLRRSA